MDTLSNNPADVNNPPAKTRGRPPIFSDVETSVVRSLFPEITTERGLLDALYRNRAVRLLKDEQGVEWLLDFTKMMQGEKNSWRPTVLAELGKISCDDELRETASEICRRKPSSNREAVALIRNYRLGEKAGDPLVLANILIHAVNDYWKRFPKIAQSDVEAAINTALAQVQDSNGGER